MSYPKVTADLTKLRNNLELLASLLHGSGMTMAAVTKCVCADARIVELINSTAVDIIADSRMANLAAVKTDKPRMLIRIPMQSESEAVVKFSDISFASEISTVKLVGAEAKLQNKRHRIMLMVDMGDLREGVFFRDEEQIFAAAEAILNEKHLELYGLGVNLSCYGGIIPDAANLGGLVELARRLRGKYSIELPMVSGGNSSTIGPLLKGGVVPEGITSLRIGEAYLLGNDTGYNARIPGCEYDAFTVSAEIVELKKKPSKPIGQSGLNAFGEPVSFEDRGTMLRGICALGRQDTNPDGLTPINPDVEVLGASSDHLLLNLTDCSKCNVGDAVSFIPDYGALLKAYTSKYVQKDYKGE